MPLIIHTMVAPISTTPVTGLLSHILLKMDGRFCFDFAFAMLFDVCCLIFHRQFACKEYACQYRPRRTTNSLQGIGERRRP